MTSFYRDLFAALPDLHATTLAVIADRDTAHREREDRRGSGRPPM
jgi:hypothetical protein